MSVKKTSKLFEKIINENLHKKYYLEPNSYNILIIENILYNDKTRLVSKFKEQMILDDIFEFLSRYYPIYESNSLLNKCISYYVTNCAFFPSYIGLPERKYIYRNINNKQRILDEQISELGDKNNTDKEKEVKIEEEDKKIFDNSVYNSILKGSSFSSFDIIKNSEKLDSVVDINNLINEMEKNIVEDNININIMKNNQDNFSDKDNIKIVKPNIFNKTNICYKKFNKKFIENMLNNKINEKNHINKEGNRHNNSSIYIKSNLKQKILNKKINSINKKEDYFPYNENKNESLFTFTNNTYFRKLINKSNSSNKRNFIYKKSSLKNKNNKLSFSVKNNNMKFKKELLKSSNRMKTHEKNNSNKKTNLNIEVYSYVNKPNNVVNYTVKNQYYNNNTIFGKNKTPIKENKISELKRIINTEITDDKIKAKKFLNLLSKENIIYVFNNKFINKQKQNKKYEKIDLNKNNGHISQNMNNTNFLNDKKKNEPATKKMKSFNNIINSIRNKMKKESKTNISQRILDLIKNNKTSLKINKKNSSNELNKNITSLKKFMKLNRLRNEKNSDLKNKLILSLEESNRNNIINNNSKTIYINNSNHSINIYQLTDSNKNKVPMNLNSGVLSNLTSPSSNKNKLFFNLNTINITPNNHIIFTEQKESNYKNYIKNRNILYPETLNNSKNFKNRNILIKQNNRINKNLVLEKSKNKLNCSNINNKNKKVNDNRIIKNNNNQNKKKISNINDKIKMIRNLKYNDAMQNLKNNIRKFN